MERAAQMDARIWIELQNYIDLKLIYAKLPMQEFFQLRLVCKDWNRLASDREFLEDSFKQPISEPYFYLKSPNPKCGPKCLLAYEATCSKWKWTRLPPADIGFARFLCNEYCIFDVQSRVFRALPPLPNPEGLYNFQNCIGMMVESTPVNRYRFLIVFGDYRTGTYIYDSKSNSWMENSSKPLETSVSAKVISCAHCDGVLHFLSWDEEFLDTYTQSYNLVNGEWRELQVPEGVYLVRDFGVWQKTLFVVGNSHRQATITLWKLADYSKNKWTVFDRMPNDMRIWLEYDGEKWLDIEILTSFCGEHILFYTTMWDVNMKAEKFVMFNLEKKIWERVDCS